MKEGYWLNYHTDKEFCIGLRGDHLRWLTDQENVEALDIPKNLRAILSQPTASEQRDRFLLLVLRTEPVMRVRGHVESVTFEFSAEDETKPLAMVREFSEDRLGPQTVLRVVNHRKSTVRQIRVRDIDGLMSNLS